MKLFKTCFSWQQTLIENEFCLEGNAAQRDFCGNWPNQREVTVAGLHFIQEDSGAAIGHAVAAWLSQID